MLNKIPCPFCGGYNQKIMWWPEGKQRRYYVLCVGGIAGCGAQIGDSKTPRGAVNQWNKRKPTVRRSAGPSTKPKAKPKAKPKSEIIEIQGSLLEFI